MGTRGIEDTLATATALEGHPVTVPQARTLGSFAGWVVAPLLNSRCRLFQGSVPALARLLHGALLALYSEELAGVPGSKAPAHSQYIALQEPVQSLDQADGTSTHPFHREQTETITGRATRRRSVQAAGQGMPYCYLVAT